MPIFIGLDNARKTAEIAAYAAANGIDRVYLFYPEKFPLEYPGARLVEYREIIMYRTFYPLLEEINPSSLLVFNECLRTQNRGELTYNCAHHYCNQTPHKIVFVQFPFIEDPQDFMILLDLLDKGRYKGKSFDWSLLAEERIICNRIPLTAQAIPVPVPPKAGAEYEKKKKDLFDNLGESDPDTIPRQLHVWAGRYKKGSIFPGQRYVARNDRFKLPNVVTYKNVASGEEYVIVDFPHRRIDFCDFLKTTGQRRIEFLCTQFKVDAYYRDSLHAWLYRLEEFYAQAGLHQ